MNILVLVVLEREEEKKTSQNSLNIDRLRLKENFFPYSYCNRSPNTECKTFVGTFQKVKIGQVTNNKNFRKYTEKYFNLENKFSPYEYIINLSNIFNSKLFYPISTSDLRPKTWQIESIRLHPCILNWMNIRML